MRVAGAAACVVAAAPQTRVWAHGVSEGEGRGRGSALPAGSAAEGHPRLLAEGPKEEEAEREGTAEKGHSAGQMASLAPSRSRQRLAARGDARAGGQWRGESEGDGDGDVWSPSPGCGAVSVEPFWSAAALAEPGHGP